ncbi:Bro-N domain-containing protein [Pseudomonas alkylphenolica]|uniref:BRO-N domain-containing protein n=1 Tax=Pseudomonas alkylphenolica TaxID=237609 RepID=UPI00315CE112
MTDLYEPIRFTRHNRPLHTLWLESQAWFCARELGRLIGRYLDEHIVRKLDADQRRTLSLLRYGEYRDTVMISESGAYTLLAHHYIPENRSLRRWLTYEVIAVLRERQDLVERDVPRIGQLDWGGHSLSLLQWQQEPWIRLRDVPQVVFEPELSVGRYVSKAHCSWKTMTARWLRL